MAHQNQLPENLPYKFTKDIRPLPGETFKKVCDYDLMYSASNFGRIRRDKEKGRLKADVILRPNRPKELGKLYVRLLKGECIRVQDLVYRAFVGSIPDNMQVACIDEDRRNLSVENLTVKPRGINRKRKKQAPSKPRVKLTPVTPKKESVTLDLTTGNKAAKLLELKGLKKDYYIASSDNGKYLLKLKKA